MYRARLFFLCIILILFKIADAQSVQTEFDTTNYFNVNSIDSVDSNYHSLVLIDSNLLTTSDTFRNIILKRYASTTFNFSDSTIKLDARKYVNRNAIKLRRPPDQWMVYTFLIIVLLYVLIKNVYNKTLSIIFQAYWNDRAISQFTRDDNFFKLRNTLLYFLLFSIVYGLLIKYILNELAINLEPNELKEFLLITGSVMAFYVSKFMLMKFAGYLFSIQKLMSGYLSIISISNFIYSLFIIPFLILYYYIPNEYEAWVLYLTLILFCFNTIYKYLRTGSFIINNFQFPKFYLFLYLCSLEIMPLLIIYKVFLA
jgi:Domain of unknown function (DUF4271)